MKKTYITPSLLCLQLSTEGVMASSPSIGKSTTPINNPDTQSMSFDDDWDEVE
ncbi:hypothetical protein [Alloprevotella sp. OH1205_COT-284]|uniref:hypothetical protein n=1 Tax=Alloprevotella sp. OH1205_COT-284 TaxID=2491043 RepID=UPI0013153D78|nr:hypothetical protein [Alloprevotella sp. OH1205_COT-284]